MINRILMELYDDYEKGNIKSLLEFAKKTFPGDGTDNLFIGCVLILFSRCNGYKPRYDATKENLRYILLSTKEKINNCSLLEIYIEKMNTTKGISKYLSDVVKDNNLENYASIILDWMGNPKNVFIEEILKREKSKV